MVPYPKVPDRITPEVIETLCDYPELLWDYLMELFNKNPDSGPKEGGTGFFASLPRGLQLYYWLVVLDGDILNAGIRKVFWNHPRWEVKEMLLAMETIGAKETADDLRTAMEIYETINIPKGRTAYWSDDEFHAEPTLNAIDAYRCSDEGSERDYAELIAYMRRHPEEFLHG